MTVNYIQRSPLQAAQDDLRRLDETIAAAQDERAKVAAFIEMYGRYAQPNTAQSAPSSVGLPSSAPRSFPAPLSIRIGNFMANKLADIDKPIPISTVMEMLVPQNLIPGGKDPKQAVSAILGKDRRFTYRQNEGWSLNRQPTFRRAGEVEMQ